MELGSGKEYSAEDRHGPNGYLFSVSNKGFCQIHFSRDSFVYSGSLMQKHFEDLQKLAQQHYTNTLRIQHSIIKICL